MDKVETFTKLIEAQYEFLQFVGGQGMAWFAFGCTINATCGWALLEGRVKTHTNAAPIVIYICNVAAALVCGIALPLYYSFAQMEILRLHEKLANAVELGNPTVHSAFPCWLYCAVSLAMALVFAVIARAWRIGIRHDSFRHVPASKPLEQRGTNAE